MALNAGDITFTILADDAKFRSTMAGASKAIGAAMTAAGAAITGFAALSIRDFAQAGDEVQKMAERTGFSTERLSELRHAAELSGTGLDSIEKASKKLATVITEAGNESAIAGQKMDGAFTKASGSVQAAEAKVAEAIRQRDAIQRQVAAGHTELQGKLSAAQEKVIDATQKYDLVVQKANASVQKAQEGGGTYTDALNAIGIKYEDLKGQSPEQQFFTVAMALADVQDKTTQVAVAQELFGRAGTQLLPMLANGSAGMAEMAAEAHRLGIVFDQAGADKAAKFNDAMQEMGESFQSLKFDVAEALIPILIDLMTWVKETMISFREWRDANQPLFEALTKITVVIGGVMAVLGPLLILLPGLATAWTAVSAAVSAFMAVAAAIGAAVSAPVAVVVAAIAAIIAAGVALVYYWDEIKAGLAAAWEAISAAFFTIWGPIIETIKWLMNTGMGVLDRVGAFFGASGNGAINQDALDRYNGGNTNFATAPGAGNARGVAAAGGGGGGISIQNFTVVSNDPNQASRDIGQNLFSALLAAGVPL